MLALTLASIMAQVATSPPAPSADEFFADLQRPVALADVAAVADLSDGVDLEISYDLPGVGEVAIAMHEHDGTGLGLVTVGGRIVTEFHLVDGVADQQAHDFGGLDPAQARMVAASVAQVWRDPAVARALAADTKPSEWSCPQRCGLAGAAGAVVVFGVSGGTCFFLVKLGKPCLAGAALAGGLVNGWISASCQGLACRN